MPKPPALLVGLIDLIAHPGDNKLAQEAYKEAKTVCNEIKDWTDNHLDFLAISQEVHKQHHGADAETDPSCHTDHNWHLRLGFSVMYQVTGGGKPGNGMTFEVCFSLTVGCSEGKMEARFQVGVLWTPVLFTFGVEEGGEASAAYLVQYFPWDYEPDESIFVEGGLVVEAEIPIDVLELGGSWELMWKYGSPHGNPFEGPHAFGLRSKIGIGEASSELLQEEVSNDTEDTVPSLLQKVTNGMKKVRKSGWRKQLPTTKGLIQLVRKHHSSQTFGNKASTGSGIKAEVAGGFGVSFGFNFT